jgi:hypothetical protein
MRSVSSFTSCMRSPLSRPASSGCTGAGPAGTMAVTTPARHPSGAGPDDIFSPAARPRPVVLVARLAPRPPLRPEARPPVPRGDPRTRPATKPYGPHVQGAGVHHNPTPGSVVSLYVYGDVFVVLGLVVTSRCVEHVVSAVFKNHHHDRMTRRNRPGRSPSAFLFVAGLRST